MNTEDNPTILEQLNMFVGKTERAVQRRGVPKVAMADWIEDEIMKVYVRTRARSIDSKIYISLDIANIEVEERFRKQGAFKYFLVYAHSINPFDLTFIENVVNKFLWDFLEKDEWILMKSSELELSVMRSYYKFIN